jgi:hypothetical protein
MKKMAIIMSVLMLIAFTAGITLAAQARKAAKVETIQGNVVKVDAAAGQIVVSVQNKEQTLKAKKQLLGSVKAGDMVSIEKTGNTVKSIKVVTAPPAGGQPGSVR